MEEPQRPNDSDCCGSGCNPCIFDIYEEKYRKWKIGKPTGIESNVMSEVKYSPFLITAAETIATNLKIFKFQAIVLREKGKYNGIHEQGLVLNVDFDIVREAVVVNSGQYFIMKGMDTSNAIISRAYTPVLHKTDLDNGIFTIAVSLLENGEMSQFFNKLIISDIVFWRGPYGDFIYNRNSFKILLLVGGGTGVVPLYNIAKSVVEDCEEETKISLLCSFKSVRHMLLRSSLNRLMDYWNFKLKIFISDSEKPVDFRPKYNETVLFKRIEETAITEELTACQKDELFVVLSGPDAFNKAIENFCVRSEINVNNIFIFHYFSAFISFT